MPPVSSDWGLGRDRCRHGAGGLFRVEPTTQRSRAGGGSCEEMTATYGLAGIVDGFFHAESTSGETVVRASQRPLKLEVAPHGAT